MRTLAATSISYILGGSRLVGARTTELDIKPEPGVQGFSESPLIALAAERERYAVFLDVDGTLLALAETPEAAEASPETLEMLQRLGGALGGALALVSGRRIADLDRQFMPIVLPASGIHGFERRDGSGRYHASPKLDLGDVRATLRALADEWPAARLEDKDTALVFHYRAAPAAKGPAFERLRRVVATRPDLEILDAKMSYEVKPRGHDKGTSILAFMDEAPFSGRTPIFLGDDVGDEPGFAAVNGLGGISIAVGGGGTTLARHRLDGVAAALDWLNELARAVATSSAPAQ